MRDYYLDCVLHDNGPETLRWGQLAAEKGGSQDKELYESLKMTFIPKEQFGLHGTSRSPNPSTHPHFE